MHLTAPAYGLMRCSGANRLRWSLRGLKVHSVNLGGVSARFLVGVGAWLLGAAAATGGSLFAVSLLGQSLAPAPSQQLTVTAVNRALASQAAEATRSPAAATPSPTPPPRHPRARRSVPATTPAATPAAKTPAAPSPAPQPTSRVLTSAGGTVVASCEASGAYLMSWSPQQGFAASHVLRGPAAKAKVTFSSSRRVVTMAVTCSGGAPSATITSHWIDE
jgi:hypothetical protein